jgi:hypothetical protein
MNASISNPAKYRRQSGQAMVEFSVLMLVFVPCILYGFFLADAGYHQLEVQETVVSTVWDFSQRNAQPEDSPEASDFSDMNTSISAVQAADRLEYNDHTSAYDPTDPSTANTDKVFNQLAVQISWTKDSAAYGAPTASGGAQVTCTTAAQVNGMKPDLQWTMMGMSGSLAALSAVNPLTEFGNADENKLAGSVTCYARAIAYNFLVPQQFEQGFAQVNLANDTSHTFSDRANVDSLSPAATDILLQDQSQIAFGTWAIDNGETQLGSSGDNDIQFGQSGKSGNPFQDRVWKVNAGTILTGISFLALQGKVLSYAGGANSKVEDIYPFVANSSLVGNTGATKFDRGDSLNVLGGLTFDPGLDPLLTFLVSRYSHDDKDPLMSADDSFGHHPVSHCAWKPKDLAVAWYVADIFTCLIKGDNKYESTPTSTAFQGSTKFMDAFNNRGPYYMGTTSDSTFWAP